MWSNALIQGSLAVFKNNQVFLGLFLNFREPVKADPVKNATDDTDTFAGEIG